MNWIIKATKKFMSEMMYIAEVKKRGQKEK